MKTLSLLSVPVRPHQAGQFCARQNNTFLTQRVALVAAVLCLVSSAAPALARTTPAAINPAASTAPSAGRDETKPATSAAARRAGGLDVATVNFDVTTSSAIESVVAPMEAEIAAIGIPVRAAGFARRGNPNEAQR